ncbi:MAG TPA: hypothetical protein PKG52_01070 [bacterium]|nr:hypothetical protein [bacterium]HPS28847.1 hypothetical protein [bacterium]
MKFFMPVFILIFLFSGCGNIVTNTKKPVITDNETENDEDVQTDSDFSVADNDNESPDMTTDESSDSISDDDTVITDEINDTDENTTDIEISDDDSAKDSRIDFTGPDFSGSTILILNGSPDGEISVSSGAFENAVPQLKTADSHRSVSGMLRNDLRPPLPENLETPHIVNSKIRKSMIPPSKFVKGDTDIIYVYDFGSGNSTAVQSTLQYVGTHIEIWKADNVSLSATDIASIGAEFDSEIYDLVTTNFYSESDIDGNGKISIILANLGGFAAGYFNPADYYTKEEYSESNFRDLIYIESGMGNDEIFSTMAHEFQHLVHSNKNILIEGDWNSGELYYRYIDEGLAMAAQHMYGGALAEMIYVINDSGYNQSIGEGNSFIYWDYDDDMKVYSDYAMAYVFIQYLRIRAGNDTTIYKEIINCTTNDYKCVENAIKSRIDPSYTFTDFLVDFRIAMLLQDKSGPYGFDGENGFEFSMPYYSGTSVSLRGGGGIYINSDGSFTKPSNSGAGIIFVGINK